MSYAIDLNARQSARTLEQAIRQQAEVILEPRIWGDEQHLLCQLEPHGSPHDLDLAPVVTLAVLSQQSVSPSDGTLASRPAAIDDLRELAGTYLDGVLQLGEQRYMFSTDAIRALPALAPDEAPRLHVNRPPILQVAQRRRFRRIKLSHAAQVDLRWIRDGLHMGGVGWLFNVGGEGMACRAEQRVAESLWIGDEVQLEFTLAPGDTERFSIRGVLCNKTPTGTLGKVILGIQFHTQESEPSEAIHRLRQRLVERAGQLAATQKEVDS